MEGAEKVKEVEESSRWLPFSVGEKRNDKKSGRVEKVNYRGNPSYCFVWQKLASLARPDARALHRDYKSGVACRFRRT